MKQKQIKPHKDNTFFETFLRRFKKIAHIYGLNEKERLKLFCLVINELQIRGVFSSLYSFDNNPSINSILLYFKANELATYLSFFFKRRRKAYRKKIIKELYENLQQENFFGDDKINIDKL